MFDCKIGTGLLIYVLARNLIAGIFWLVEECPVSKKDKDNKKILLSSHADSDLADHSLRSEQSSKTAQGKSIKKLLKENKKLVALHSHEKIPDSELFAASLKGHSAAVLSTDISPDSTRVVTTCEDNVCTPPN